MQLALVIPGLVWPVQSLGNAARDLELPALSTLLGRGELRRIAPVAAEDLLARDLGLDPERLPWGALRLAGEGGDPGAAPWMCADPVHLRFAGEALVLADARVLQLQRDECDAIAREFNAQFAELGELRVASAERWYLRLNSAPDIQTHPLRRVLGRRVDAYMPAGREGAAWRRIANETQMMLHAHAVNTRREAQGRPVANSLWFWGCGTMPEPQANPGASVFADDPLLRGTARAAGARSAARPRELAALLAECAAQRVTLVLDELDGPALCEDLSAWRAALTELDRRTLAPLLAALYAGELEHLRVCGLGDAAAFELDVGSRDRWRFWRRPRPLASVAPLADAA